MDSDNLESNAPCYRTRCNRDTLIQSNTRYYNISSSLFALLTSNLFNTISVLLPVCLTNDNNVSTYQPYTLFLYNVIDDQY
jgi:hypothetical protein